VSMPPIAFSVPPERGDRGGKTFRRRGMSERGFESINVHGVLP
jgi:hypothetical protein